MTQGTGDTCPACGDPIVRVTIAPSIWCCGVGTSHAYHHEGGRACVVRGTWTHRGDPDPHLPFQMPQT